MRNKSLFCATLCAIILVSICGMLESRAVASNTPVSMPGGLNDAKLQHLSETAASAAWKHGKELIGTDKLTPGDIQISLLVDTAQALLSATSADGKTGYVIVKIPYENKNGKFEDFYRVDWEVDRLIGVRPMERFLLGGLPLEKFSDKFLRPAERMNLHLAGKWSSPDQLDVDVLLGTYQFYEFSTSPFLAEYIKKHPKVNVYELEQILTPWEIVESHIQTHLNIPAWKLRASKFFSNREAKAYRMRALDGMGSTDSIGDLDKAWGTGNTTLMRAIGFGSDTAEIITYLLVEENGERFTYLAGYSDYTGPSMTAEIAQRILQAWLDDHPFKPHAVLAPEHEEYSDSSGEYYKFSLADNQRYWLNFLVHKKTGELLFMMISDGEETHIEIEPLDEWYDKHIR